MASLLSRHIKRACLDKSWTLPPTFLLPFAANLSTVSHTTDASNAPDVLVNSATKTSPDTTTTTTRVKTTSPLSSHSPSSSSSPASPASPSSPSPLPTPSQTAPVLGPSVRELLPALRAQGPHYITAHIYDRPYLVTAGDTVRLPFLMQGVNPGDILRLNRATSIGSRDFTLKAAASTPNSRSPTASTTLVIDPTPGSFLASHSRVMPGDKPSASLGADGVEVDHFVPHQAKGKTTYLDDRLFVCRAVVMGVEAEPMRIKEKTKRRQRRTKTVKSKHRYTVLRIQQVDIKSADETESN
ncbi:hypothetical protein AAFC00_006155 [Neodothiora populina]|uniref:Large ribosomal subunit protein bL21m n=1 Tax=Neodothiora populina TaxID=2781224 RepID=A0ABR3P4E2_9PEZI